MTAAALTIDYVALEKRLRKLERLNPRRAHAVVKTLAFYLQDERDENRARRERATGRRMDRTLLAAHDCGKVGGFEQLPPIDAVKQWRCLGCGARVTNEKGGV